MCGDIPLCFLIHISLIVTNFEHFKMCLFANCILSLVKCLLNPFPNWIVILWLNFETSIYILESSPLLVYRYFLLVCSMSFYLLYVASRKAKAFHSNEMMRSNHQFFLLRILLLVSSLKTLCLSLHPEDLLSALVFL